MTYMPWAAEVVGPPGEGRRQHGVSLGVPQDRSEVQALQEQMCHRETDLILKHKQTCVQDSVNIGPKGISCLK